MVSSVRCFLVQLFLNSIDRISDALGHAEHVMQLYHLQTVHSLSPHPITAKKNKHQKMHLFFFVLCCHSKHMSQSSMHRVSKEEHASSVPQTRLRRVP